MFSEDTADFEVIERATSSMRFLLHLNLFIQKQTVS